MSSRIPKFLDLLGDFDEKDTVDFNKYHFLLNNSKMSDKHTTTL